MSESFVAPKPTTLAELQKRCFEQAVAHGWNEQPIPLPEMLALIHSEASEALESYRNREKLSWTDAEGKPQGVGSEFADIMIRIGHYATKLGLDMDYECRRKLEFNDTRPYRHGGKLA